MKRINKFIDKYGSIFDPLIFQFDGVSYIPYRHKDGTRSYHEIPRKEKGNEDKTNNGRLH